MKSHLFYSFN